MFWTVEIRDSDGNDCTVYDWIIEADSGWWARDKAFEEAQRRVPDAEHDGDSGAYYPCDCEIPEGEEDSWECSHGGYIIGEPEGPFDSSAEAWENAPYYHVREEI